MIERKAGGKIINVGSLTSLIGIPYISIYGSSKGAVAEWTRCLAAEWGQYDIQVNCIAPGVVETPLTEPIKRNEEWYGAYARKSALGRWAKADEMAGPTVFLASDAASYVNGQAIAVDGGLSSSHPITLRRS